VGRRLILDTGVLVAAERGRIAMRDLIDADDDTALSVITVTELLVGVLRADDDQRGKRQAALDRARAVFTVIDYTPPIAQSHAELLVHTREAGLPRGPMDLIIAATARATGRTLVTLDRKATFGDLPGVQALEL
jgi:tRNA(fMet)-specific endonuclease VapC